MAKGTIGGKIVLEGESQYRAALKNIKSDQAELRSEMKLCTSTYKENQNSMEALSKKQEILTKQVETQTQKVEIYQKAMAESAKKQQEAAKRSEELKAALQKAEKEMQEMVDSSDASEEALQNQAQAIDELKRKLALAEQDYDKAAQKTSQYKTAVNNAQAELQGMQLELSKVEKYVKEATESTDKCATSIDQYGKEVKEAADDTGRFGDVLKANLISEVVMSGLSKLKDLAMEVGGALKDCAVGAAQYADDIATTSTNTGIAAKTLQELTYAQELMDVSLDTVTSTMAKNIKSMDSARKGSADYVAAYEKLGVTLQDTNGEFRSSEDIFWEVIDALGQMENATDRDATAMQVFGKSAQDLNSLIAIGSSGFKELAKQANESGFVLEDEVISNLLKTSDAMEVMNNRITASKNRIGAELAPVFEKTFDKIGTSIENAEDVIVEFAEDAIPELIAGMEWILKNADLVAAGIGAVTSATVYHSAVAPAIATVTSAWHAYQKANEGATVSQWLLNTAMNANPAGILVTSIMALAGAATAYLAVNKEVLFTTDEVTMATREQVTASKELNAELEKSVQERSQSRAEMEVEATTASRLVTELKGLEAKTKLTATEQNRMKTIVSQLNTIVPDLNLAINEQTGKLNMSTKAIEKNVQAMLAMSKAEAARKDLTEIAEQQFEAEKKLTELQEQLEEQTTAVAEAQEKLNEEYAKYEGKTGNAYRSFNKELALQYESAVKAQADLQEQIGATQASIDVFESEYAQTMDYIANNEALASAKAATEELGNAANETGTELADMASETKTAFEEMHQSLSETISGQISLFEEFAVKSEVSAKELLKNMQSQVDGVSSWADNLEQLGERGISHGLLQHLSSMGPEGAGYVATFVKMTDEELQKANDLFDKYLQVPKDAADKLTSAYEEAGGFAGDGFRSGMEGSKDKVFSASEDMARVAIEAMRVTLDIHSPSKKMEEIGEDTIDGVIVGAEGRKPLLTSTMRDIGLQMTNSLRDGITSGASGVVQAVQKMCSEAVEKARQELAMVNAAISNASVEASVPRVQSSQTVSAASNDSSSASATKSVNVAQTINIYSQTDNVVETTRKMKQAQKEVAMEW